MRQRTSDVIGVVLVIALGASLLIGQQRSLSLESEPFRLERGREFSASGGSRAVSTTGKAADKITVELREAEALIQDNYVGGTSLTVDGMTRSAVSGMLNALDPHSRFYDKPSWRSLLNDQQGVYTGIGATIAEFARDGSRNTYILATAPGSPAAAGLAFGDRVVAIGGRSVLGANLEEIRDRIRGPVGVPLTLTVERGTSVLSTLTIRREHVPQPTIPDYHLLNGTVGYIGLTDGFSSTTVAEFDRALATLRSNGMTSLLLDLRGNGGGIVEQAVKIAERFLPSGTPILTQRGRTSADDRSWHSHNPTPITFPLVVLVDEDTASAAEIVAGALQDNDRAIVVGQKTFGKGLVQSVIDLPEGCGITLTAARYLTPTGRSIQRDYTERYDYFAHKNSTESIGSPYFEARTITGRTVIGGDGIHPDEVIAGETLTHRRATMLDTIFFQVRDELVGKPVAALRPAPVDQGFADVRLRYYRELARAGISKANKVLVENDPQVVGALRLLPKSGELAALAERMRRGRKNAVFSRDQRR